MKHEKSTFGVLFYLKKDRIKSDGSIPVYARITVDKKFTQFNTKLKCKESSWESGKAVGKSTEVLRLNTTLNEIRTTIHNHYHTIQQRDGYVTAERVKNAFLGKEEQRKTIVSFFEQHNEQFRLKVGNNLSTHKSYTRYELTKNRLITFMREKYRVDDIPIREMNPVFIEKFYMYIRENYECTHNTAMKFVQRVRTIVNYAKNTGSVTADPFANYRLKFEYVERAYLDQQEIDRIWMKSFASERLEQVRDIFVFSCYTGLSYIDICELKSENIRPMFDGHRWIVMPRHKTKVISHIRLLDIPEAILRKYEEKQLKGKLLPIISNQKMNDYLKEIADVCGTRKKITFHAGRHSFATLALGYGVPIETVSKMLGHTNIRTTQVYARITDRKLSDDMEMMARKLNGRSIKNG